jgi:hypothetical protein
LSGDHTGPGAGSPLATLTHPGGHLPQAVAPYDWQLPLQFFEQHSESAPQNDPFDLQGRQLPWQLPEQQVSGDVQADPVSTQQPLTPPYGRRDGP